MRVAFLVRSVPPVIDGVGDYTWQLSRSLRQLGIEAHIFTSTDQLAGARLAEWIYPIIPRWTGETVAEALASVAGFRPDWCCLQYVPQMYGRRGVCWTTSGIPMALKKRCGCRIAVMFHEITLPWKLDLKVAVLAGMTRLQARRLLAGCDLAITTSARYVETLLALTPRSIPIVGIPVGSNINLVQMGSDDILALRRQYFPEGSKIFGMFGRLASDKNYPTAVRVLERAKQHGLNARLLLIGWVQSSNPNAFEGLQQLAKKLGVETQMAVTGDLSADAVSAHLQLVDVFLFPQENGISTGSTVVMTALAHGLPIVAYTPMSGNYDGYQIPYSAFVPPGDEEGFIDTAVRFLRETDDNPGGGNANADYFIKHFTWPRIAEQYVEAFTAVEK